jgi:hypothetical protein
MGSDAALDAQFGIRILDYDVKWEIKGDEIVVTDLVELNKLISKLKR